MRSSEPCLCANVLLNRIPKGFCVLLKDLTVEPKKTWFPLDGTAKAPNSFPCTMRMQAHEELQGCDLTLREGLWFLWSRPQPELSPVQLRGKESSQELQIKTSPKEKQHIGPAV